MSDTDKTPPAETPPAVETPNGALTPESVKPGDIVRPLSAEETRGATAPPPAAPAAETPAAENPFAGVKDSLGREFDPVVFRLKNGQPQVDTRGRFVPAGLGRRTGGALSTIPPDSPAVPAAAAQTAPLPPAPDEYHLAAQAACRALYALGMLLGGDEWMPEGDEHTNLVNAAEAYFRAKQFKDVPPGLALTIAVAGYVAPRLSKPKTLSRLEKLRLWWAGLKSTRRAESIAGRAASVS
jgi:hypothetical protein